MISGEQFKQNTSFKLFPEDVVKDNGKVIYILIKNLIGKEPPGRVVELEYDLTRRAVQIREQYCQLLRFLQECGACLNTVFPEYLLDFNLYKRYIASDVNRQKVLAPNWEKSSALSNQWRYYHKESWVLLVYQILKIFYLARVNPRSYALVIKQLPPDVQQRHSVTRFGASNVYSQAEYLLLRWLTACFETVNPHLTREPKTFSSDFQDSALLSSLVLSYFPKEEKNLSKRNKQANDLKLINYNTIITILKEYGIYTHVKNFQISPTSVPNAREMVLFLAMLFQNIKYFNPKLTSELLGDLFASATELSSDIYDDVLFHSFSILLSFQVWSGPRRP